MYPILSLTIPKNSTTAKDTKNLQLQGKFISTLVRSGVDENIGAMPKDPSTIRYSGFLFLGIFVTFLLLSVGMLALYCKRQYKKFYYEQ